MGKKWAYNKYFFTITSFIFCCVCFFIFYSQATSTNGYPSDMHAHIGFIINPGNYAPAGYSLLHQIIKVGVNFLSFFKISKLILCSILMILTLVSSLFFTLMVVNNYFQKRYREVNPYIIDLMSLALMIVSMIIINPNSPHLYLGTGTPNPWHNPTYIFCKPFSILVFIYLLKSIELSNENKDCTKELIFLSLFSVLSMWAKPSFLISFLPSVVLLFIYKLLKKEISIRFLILSGISFLPSMIPLFIMNSTIFNSANSTNSIIIAAGQVWSNHSKNIPLSIVLAAAFPLYVFILNVKQLSTSHLLAFINYILAMLIYFFLAEKGVRMYHGNFSWGYLFALFFLFFVSIEEFFFKKKTSKGLYIPGLGLFLLHLFSGLFYLSVIVMGHNYF
jgi:hypothetical protein